MGISGVLLYALGVVVFSLLIDNLPLLSLIALVVVAVEMLLLLVLLLLSFVVVVVSVSTVYVPVMDDVDPDISSDVSVLELIGNVIS